MRLLRHLALVLAVGSGSGDRAAAAPDRPTPEAVEKAKAALRAEPKIKDVAYNPDFAVQWHVGVLTDGTPRYGYAGYLCQVLGEHGVVTPRTEVRVVDIARIARGEDFRAASLGRVNCSTGRQSSP